LKQAREILQLLMSRERLKRDRIELASDIIVAQVTCFGCAWRVSRAF
jgi:hypothetical protein